MTDLKELSSSRCYGGYQKTFSHESSETKCKMTFSAYIPEKAEKEKCPVMYFLSGLTCTEQNFIIKSSFQRYANEFGFVVIGPDTSPRGCNVEGESESWDFGVGASFYVDATVPKWATNWRMGSYVSRELPALVNANFPVAPGRACVSGHSMGGHGALISALRNPTVFRSVSAFAPIANPSKEPWGIKALSGYFGEDREAWREWDATELVSTYQAEPFDILIDIGTCDQYATQGNLLVDNFVTACTAARMPVTLRRQEGYDHSYYFVGTFLRDHFAHHARILAAI